MSGPLTEDPGLPIRPLVALLLKVRREHSDDATSGVCPICCVSRCERAQWAGGELNRGGYDEDGRLRWADLLSLNRVDEEPQP